MKVHPSVLERRKWKKFGDSAGLESGPDANSTSLGENVFMQWISSNQAQQEQVETQKVSLSILCRICKGNHFSSKCPYKDTYSPLDSLQNTLDNAKESIVETKSGKYVPPSLRSRGPGDTMPVREQLPTIRITNLSEEATEMDVRQLVSRFGHPSRVFVARDRDLNICKGFAFVSYPTREMASKALNSLNGYGYDNLILKVEWSIKEN